MRFAITFVLSFALLIPNANAQRGGRGGEQGGGRGGEQGGRGSQGGGFPSRGGGGTQGGGFPSRSRGGDTGGGRSGFDPSSMLSRFDRNGNGSIEPEEAQGPAQFFLQRLAQNNPKIDLKKPIPISTLTEAIQRSRGGDSASSSSSSSTQGSNNSDEPALLVPDFTSDMLPEPLLGFGAGSEMFAVRVLERDIKESEERMRRYDSNKDGKLDADELRRGRWSDDPMSYDRNRDGFLSTSELAVRYAKRRLGEEERRETQNQDRSRTGGDRRGWSSGQGRKEEEEKVDRFGDAKSFRTENNGADGEGLPGFFSQRDSNKDGQVTMAEFTSKMTNEQLDEFMKWDITGDGIIEPRECLAVLKSGGSAPSSSSSRSSSPKPSGNISQAHLEWAKRMIGKYDSNGDKQLTKDEWSKMIVKPTKADYDKNGVITIEEYARYRAG
ncbi:MAG: hypothetical protein Aurels2KO_28350 [Aureliella sp.]